MRGSLHTARWFVVAVILSFAARTAAADDGTFTASVDKNPVASNDQFTLTFTLSGASVSGASNFHLPDLSAFLVLSGPDQSTNMQIINGAVSSSTAYAYVLQPRQTGKFTIGSATIEAGGKRYTSQPLTLTVVRGTAAAKSQPQAATDQSVRVGDNLFLRATVDRSRVYQGEQVTVTFRIFTRVRVVNYSIQKLPNMIGFWSEDLDIPQQVNLTNEVVNGKQYQVGVLKKVALFPTQSGTLEVNPLEIVCQVQVQNRGRSNDWFDQFFNDPFSNSQTANVGVKSEPLRITVLPLPKGSVPGSFRGAVGRYTLAVSMDKTNVKTNEPVTLKAVISGTGNIKILEAPSLSVPNDFEKYDPKVTESIDRSGGVVHGSKSFEWLLVPRYPGTKRIPALEFAYFDPSLGRYQTLHSTAIDLSVAKGSSESAPLITGISKEDVKLLNQDIRFIKTDESSLVRRGQEDFNPATVAAATLLPLLAFVGLAAYRQKVAKETSDVVGYRSRKALKVATKRLQEAKALIATENADPFYAEIARALWKYLGDRLAIDQADLSIDTVSDRLRSRKVRDELVTQVRECLDACEFARFAPARAEAAEKRRMYDLASGAIVAVEKELS